MMVHIMMVLLFVVLTLKNAKWLKNLAGAHSEECGSASTTHRPIFDLRLPVMIMMVAYLHICIFAYLLTNRDHHDGCICKEEMIMINDNYRDDDEDNDDGDDDDTHLAKSSADSMGLSIRSTVRKAALPE